MITARPILMSAPMVRSILEGIKTQTRRCVSPDNIRFLRGGINEPIVKYRPTQQCLDEALSDPRNMRFMDNLLTWDCPGSAYVLAKPKYQVGDLLWVRERAHYGPDRVAYSAGNPALAHGEKVDGWGPARPSIHMPRWASRLTLELTDVRVERLLDISEDDARAEGFEDGPLGDPIPETPIGDGWTVSSPGGWASAAGHFQVLWQKLHPEWDGFDSPWVWVLTFKVHHANVDTVLAQRAEVAA